MLLCSTQYCFRPLTLPFLNRGFQQTITNSGILAYHLPFGEPSGSLLSLLSGLASFSTQLKPLLSSFILRFSWATHRKCVCLISFLSEQTHVLYSLKMALTRALVCQSTLKVNKWAENRSNSFLKWSFTLPFCSCKQNFEWCYGQ